MDLNYLYYRRGVECLRAGAASCEPSREAHLDLAERYGVLIHHERAGREARYRLRAGGAGG